ncbi:MAG TPA: AsmA family protein, partial [Burkholderiales bacterium]|nr:AsmA family protein [Burkholderiales bacterium]
LGQVAVGAMTASKVTLQLAKSGDEQRKPPESLSAPLSFAITDFQIGTLQIVAPDATHELRDLRAAFAGSRRELNGEVKSLATQYGNIKGQIKVGARKPFPLDANISITAPDPQLYSIVASVGGTLLDADASIDAKARDGKATARLAIAPFEIQPLTQLELSAKDFDPRAWSATAPGAKLSGEAHLASDIERVLNGTVAFTNSEPGTIDDKKVPFARLSAMLQGSLAALSLHDIELDLASAGQFSGDGEWRDGALDVNLDTRNLNLRGMQKPLHQTKLAGELSLGGNVSEQHVRFNLKQAPYHFRFNGALSDGIAKIDEAYARAGNAEVTTHGRVALDSEKSFDIAGRLRKFDPSRFGAYPSQLINGGFEVKGHVEPVLQVAADMNVTNSRLYGLPAQASGRVKSRRTDHPDVAMDITLRVGDTQATVKGIIQDPAALHSMDLQLTLAGANLAELYQILGVPLPPTPRYRIQGQLLHRGELWEFRQFAGVVGDSDLSGDFLVDRGRTPQFMKADLKSNRLALADLAGFIGAEKTESGKVKTANPSRVLPDSPYNLEKLKAANADIRFEGKQILTERLPVKNISTHLVVKDGVLTLSPLDFGTAGGNLVSDIILDGRNAVIASRADIRVESLQLEQLAPQLKGTKASVGQMDGRMKLTARGNSIAAMLGSANGDTTLVVGEGEVSDLILRLSNLDLANALLVLMRGDRNIPIRCMVADLAFENGIMHPRRFVLDTAHTTLLGEGKANFADETLDLRLVAKPRENSLVALRGPIVVRGTFAHPSGLPDMKQLTARGAAMIGLGLIATPLAAIVPLVQFGHSENVQCGPLLQAARQKIQEPDTQIASR